MYQYTYIIGNLILLGVWSLIFLKRKDIRKEMIVIGLIFGFFSFFNQITFVKDYWEPDYFLGQPFFIEDFIFGFLITGVAAAAYEILFAKKFLQRFRRVKNWEFILLFIFLGVIFLSLFFILGLNSMYACFLAFIIAVIIIFIFRPDLIWDSFFSGIFLALLSFLIYQVLIDIYPGFIERWWLLQNVSGVLVLGVPIEEIIWFFLLGMVLGPLYEFWQGYKLIAKKR